MRSVVHSRKLRRCGMTSPSGFHMPSHLRPHFCGLENTVYSCFTGRFHSLSNSISAKLVSLWASIRDVFRGINAHAADGVYRLQTNPAQRHRTRLWPFNHMLYRAGSLHFLLLISKYWCPCPLRCLVFACAADRLVFNVEPLDSTFTTLSTIGGAWALQVTVHSSSDSRMNFPSLYFSLAS